MQGIYKDERSDEWYFPPNSYVLSETDHLGNILYANDLFCHLAGYEQGELLGEPHNILRHKDMPRIAFKGLWEDVKNKGFWVGIVKNLRKDGAYYWVKATVLRKVDVDGKVTYLSIRTVPTREEVNSASDLYYQLVKEE